MATNLYFSQKVKSEQNLYEDIVIESLKMYGQDVYYLPRDLVNEDRVLGDDPESSFNSSHVIEMYIENTEGFEGEGDLMSKFGIQVRDQATFVISLRSWERFISLDSNLATSFRPNEGDLIYFPLSGSMFEIKFVEHEDPFYQVGKLFVFKLRAELFEYSQEDFDTGIGDIDQIEDEQAYSLSMTMNNGNSNDFVANENLSKSGTVVAEVVSWNQPTSKLLAKDITTTLAVGDVLIGAISGAQYTIASIDDRMTFSNDAAAQNLDFENKDSSYLDLSEINPFGEP